MNEDLRNAAQGRANKVSLIEDMQSLTRQVNNQVFLFYVRQRCCQPDRDVEQY